MDADHISKKLAIMDDHDSKVTVDEDNVDYDNFLSTKKDNKVLEEQPDGNNGLDDVHVDIDVKDVDKTNLTTVVVPFEQERKVGKACQSSYGNNGLDDVHVDIDVKDVDKTNLTTVVVPFERERKVGKACQSSYGFEMETRKRKASASISKPDAASSSKPDVASSSKSPP
nr:hypothetical protein [Tanacetum cinerariifolium]